VVPEPLTPLTAGEPPRPPFASAKSLESTPVTLSLNITVQWTVEALVGLASTLVIETTVGTVASIVRWKTELSELAPPSSSLALTFQQYVPSASAVTGVNPDEPVVTSRSGLEKSQLSSTRMR
jgi:hypothetical protein